MPDRSTSRGLENYPADIVDWVIDHFDADAIPYVHLLLEDLKEDRLIRCALFLSRGSIKELEGAVSLGKTEVDPERETAGTGGLVMVRTGKVNT